MRKKWRKHDKLEDTILVKIRAISEETTDTKELSNPKKLDTLQCNLQYKMDSLVLKSFVLYQQMLSTTLYAELDDIVQDYCFMTG